MNAFFRTIFNPIAGFLESKVKRRLLLIAVISLIAAGEFLYLGLARRTFVFYTISDGEIVVEDRMLAHTAVKEGNIKRYVEEALLGPVSPYLLPLFQRETRLNSLLFRDGVVYADFSAEAAMPPVEGGRMIDNFRTFYDGILRNFSYVKDVRFFIEGHAVYAGEFPR